jgi:hypothetical protein
MFHLTHRLLLAATCIAALAGIAACPAAATWEVQNIPGGGINTALLSISCPTKSFCVAVGEGDTVASSSNPAAGASTWTIAEPAKPGDSDDNKFTTDPSKYRDLRGVSCPSPSLCVVVTFDGFVYTSTNPGGGEGAWQVADVDGKGRDTHLMSISCPTPSLCVAVSGDRYTSGKVVTSTDPTGGPAAWSTVQLDETLDLRGVSCASPSSCVAVAENGRVLVSSNPTGPPSDWREIGAPAGPGNLQGVSCVAALCVAGNAAGNLLSSTNPLAGAGAWSTANGGGAVQITGVSCLSTKQCVAVDNNGSVMTSVDPTGGAPAWTFENVIPYVKPGPMEQPFNAMFGVSCASKSFCAATAANSRIFVNEDPFADLPGGESGQKQKKRARRPKRPRTTIAHVDGGNGGRTRKRKVGVRFRFYANGRVRGFLCKLDDGPFKPCHSPARYRVGLGKHVFRVRAIGLTGLRGPIALDRFTVFANPNV